MGCALRRHVRVSKKYLGSWEVYPSLYIMFIGPPGVIKKSTTVGYAEELLDGLPNLAKAPAGLSVPVLIQRLAASDDSSIYILSSEFSTLIQKAGPAMYEILTDLFDGRKNIDEGTISRGHVFVERPVVNMLAATTPSWIGENMSEGVLGGGFASRVIFIHEHEPRQYMLYYKNVDQDKIIQQRDELIHDLQHIADNIHGDFEITAEALEYMENWYRANAKTPAGADRKLTGYYQRRPAHIHKIAILQHLAYSDELVLTLDDFKSAIREVSKIESKIADTFRAVGKNTYIADMDGITAFVREKGKVEQSVLLKQFESAAEPAKLQELVSGLIAIGDLKVVPEGLQMYYMIPPE